MRNLLWIAAASVIMLLAACGPKSSDNGSQPLGPASEVPLGDTLRLTIVPYEAADKLQDGYSPMATYLVSSLPGFNAGYADGNLAPGRPIADPGPNRVVRPGATTLSAAMSLYSTTFQWSIVGGPAGATLSNPTSASPVFTATANGTYVLQLVSGNGSASSAPAQLRLALDTTLPYDPAALRFADIKSTLQTGAGNCTGCHKAGGNGTVLPPVWYSSYDRAGTGAGTENSATNDHWFYTELRGGINFTDWIASPLLRKPSGNHHFGGERAGFKTSVAVGDPQRADYDKFVSWIVQGAPE